MYRGLLFIGLHQQAHESERKWRASADAQWDVVLQPVLFARDSVCLAVHYLLADALEVAGFRPA